MGREEIAQRGARTKSIITNIFLFSFKIRGYFYSINKIQQSKMLIIQLLLLPIIPLLLGILKIILPIIVYLEPIPISPEGLMSLSMYCHTMVRYCMLMILSYSARKVLENRGISDDERVGVILKTSPICHLSSCIHLLSLELFAKRFLITMKINLKGVILLYLIILLSEIPSLCEEM